MIRKSGNRFSENIMLKKKETAHDPEKCEIMIRPHHDLAVRKKCDLDQGTSAVPNPSRGRLRRSADRTRLNFA
jgi:hypothetical protein